MLREYGYTGRIRALFAFHFPDPNLHPARVVRADRGRVLLAPAAGWLHPRTGGLDGRPATGDWVAYDGARPDAEGGPVLAGILPRYSALARKKAYDPLSQEQVLAANIDVVGVVVPLDRPLSRNRLERILVAGWDSGAVPLVIVTKADLAGAHSGVVAQVAGQAGAAEVVTTSAETGDGLDELAQRVRPGQTLALLGPSGAGKSS
ncbi:GTPase RsgA, partial [Arthrobacter deserti]|nr:GTPase RsgA [Arthrobacter deserti]